jgi:hypothetical protein
VCFVVFYSKILSHRKAIDWKLYRIGGPLNTRMCVAAPRALSGKRQPFFIFYGGPATEGYCRIGTDKRKRVRISILFVWSLGM